MQTKTKRRIWDIILIFLPLLLGTLFSFLTPNQAGFYETIRRPPFSPPAIVFPIVWPVYYLLLGISLYLIVRTQKNQALSKKEQSDFKLIIFLFATELVLNYLWSFIFFGGQKLWLAFFELLIMLIVQIVLNIKIYGFNKVAGLLQIPYTLWLVFALYLNLATAILN